MKHIKLYEEREYKPQIDVFITKTMKFRVRIKESRDSAPYEVTVGGAAWKGGKGRIFEDIIIKKMMRLVDIMNDELNNQLSDETKKYNL